MCLEQKSIKKIDLVQSDGSVKGSLANELEQRESY
jgi:hypothetical protein